MLFLCLLHPNEELEQVWASMFKQRAALLDWEVKEIDRNGWENQLLKSETKTPTGKAVAVANGWARRFVKKTRLFCKRVCISFFPWFQEC
jgi:hypothetical protein